MDVRLATIKDAPDVFLLLAEMHMNVAEDLALPVFSGPKVARKIDDCLRDGAILLSISEERIVGILGLLRGSFWYSDAQFVGDAFFYVTPSARTSTAARDLLKAAKLLEKENLPVLLATVTGKDVDRKDFLYERLGYKKIGSVFAVGI